MRRQRYLLVIATATLLAALAGIVATVWDDRSPRPVQEAPSHAPGTRPSPVAAKLPADAVQPDARAQAARVPGGNAPIRVTENASRVLSRAAELGSTYQLLSRQLDLVDSDDLGLLRRIVIECSFVLRGRDGPEGFAARFLRQGASEKPARVAAARVLATACDGMPADAASEQLVSAAQQEAVRRRAALAQALWLAATAAHGSAARSIDDAAEVLASRDIFAIEIALRHIGDTAARADSAERIDSGDLVAAWELARCQIAKGCGAESLPVLMRCLSRDQCGASTLEEIYRLHEPDRLAVLAPLSRRMLASYQTGDWSWLKLEQLRSRIP